MIALADLPGVQGVKTDLKDMILRRVVTVSARLIAGAEAVRLMGFASLYPSCPVITHR